MKTKNSLLSLTIFLSIILTACGGGGGGGGPAPITYSGVTTPADVNSGNATEVSGGATEMGTFGGAAGLVASTDSGTDQNMTGTSILARTAIKAITSRLNADTAAIGAVTTVSESAAGSCGGTSSINLSVDDVSFTFSGSLSFVNFCEGDITLNGTANISGNLSGSTITFTMTIPSLVVNDKSTGYTYKAENYVTVITANTSVTSISVTITGKFYHPVHGYVLVTTLSPLLYSGTSAWPYAGAIKVTEDGSGTVDSATLTALNSTQYQIDIDLGNDGSVDSSTIGNWADL